MHEKTAASNPAARTVLGTFTVQHQLSQQRAISVMCYLFEEENEGKINGKVDSIQRVINRQFILADIEAKEGQIAQKIANIASMKDHLEGLEAKRKAPGGAIKLKTQESNALENLAANIEAETKAIDSLKSAIAEARKKLAALDG